MSDLKLAGLDHPVWSALTTKQAHLGQGDVLARRYHPDVAPFAALAAETISAYHALHALLRPLEQVALLSVEPMGQVDGFDTTHVGVIHQMIASHCTAGRTDNDGVVRLGPTDVNDMLELVRKTRPGPFSRRTVTMGNYIGIRERGRLVAMAGERMRLEGYVEISAVCVDDEHRGKGHAARLVNALQQEIERNGETPFLHVFSDNVSAIRLYERLGWQLRRTFHLNRIEHAHTDSVAAR
jgi:ribosomal protein S18 acetylase RimI-like enzyme